MKRTYEKHSRLTKQHLLSTFRYSDGKLFDATGRNIGTLDRSSGYRKILYNNERYMEHIIIWIIHFGSIPSGYVIDHINYNKSDNRIENLRLATRSESNQHRQYGKGYYYDKNRKKFIVKVKKDKTVHYGGSFDSENEAKDAAKELRFKLHGNFHRDFGYSEDNVKRS